MSESTSAARLEHLQHRVRGLGYGADYNPEQWPPEIWDEDIRLMKDTSVTMVTLGIFAWAQVEPRPGEFRFEWMDDIMDRLADAGISVSLATMTASPPAWLAAQHPETLPVREDGVQLWPGSRQQYCPSSPIYREYATRLVEKLADRYGEHPALALWHIGNEYGCHVPHCYCDVSAEAFRRWLIDRYGDVDALNEAWTTSFWSQRYEEWAEIQPPRTAPSIRNPAHQIDYMRFSSDELLVCYLAEREVCLRVTPSIPVTTNLLGARKPMDYFTWADHLDIISYDSYPDPLDPRSHVEAAFTYDLMRSMGRGRPWLLMEQAPSAVNWRDFNQPKPPGLMRLWSYQALARGADACLFFQWRQSLGGAEKYHSAVVPHGGQELRVFREARELGAELQSLSEITGSRLQADVALVHDWPSWWGLELESHPSTALTQRDANLTHYTPLWDEHITADIVHPSADLSGYRLVIVPNLYMVGEDAASNLRQYVAGGGRLLMSFFSGIVDENDRVHLGGYPAPFREMLGLRIDEFWPLADHQRVGLLFDDGTTTQASIWSESIVTETAQTLATYADGPLEGQPAVTRNEFGRGLAWYLGTRLDEVTMRRLIGGLLKEAGIRPPIAELPDGVEAVVRHGKESRYLFLINHTDREASLTKPQDGEVTIGQAASDKFSLPGRDLAVLRLPPERAHEEPVSTKDNPPERL